MNIFVGYIKGKRKHEFIINKPRLLKNVSYCYSSYVDFKDASKITMGELNTIIGDITIFKYQQQNTVTQSSPEADYITLLEEGKENKSTQILLQEIATYMDIMKPQLFV